MSQIKLSLPHPQPQSLPLLQHKRIKRSQKQLLKPPSLPQPHPHPEEQEFWQFVAAKSLMGFPPVFWLQFIVCMIKGMLLSSWKNFRKQKKYRRIFRKGKRTEGLVCKYFIKNGIKKRFSCFFWKKWKNGLFFIQK